MFLQIKSKIKKIDNFLWISLASAFLHFIFLLAIILALGKIMHKDAGQKNFLPVDLFKPRKPIESAEDFKKIEEKKPTDNIKKEDAPLNQTQNLDKTINQYQPTLDTKYDADYANEERLLGNKFTDMPNWQKALPNYNNQINSDIAVNDYELKELEPDIKYKLPKREVRNLNYSVSDYSWSFKTYVEQWAVKIIRAWKIPVDYAKGLFPEGGYALIKVKINKKGELLGFEIIETNISQEMSLKSLQALMGSFTLNQLPADAPETLDFYWKFIYPEYIVFNGKQK